MSQHQHSYRTGPASDEYRANYDAIFGKKPDPQYETVTYHIPGADTSPEMQRALDKSMQQT